MEKLDAVRDTTNTLRVYSRLWLCFRDWVERESIVGVSRDSELPLPPSTVPADPCLSATRVLQHSYFSPRLPSPPKPQGCPPLSKASPPQPLVGCALAPLRAQSNPVEFKHARHHQLRVSTRGRENVNGGRRRSFARIPSFPSFFLILEKNMIGNRHEKSIPKYAHIIYLSNRRKSSSFLLFSGNGSSEVN